MKGYLTQEIMHLEGHAIFVESLSPENSFGVAFQDDGDTAYFYAMEIDQQTKEPRILDALHIYQIQPPWSQKEPVKLMIIWSRDWMKAALVMDGQCHALFDFLNQGGYNINEFPPPNEIWTKRGRKLSNELIAEIF
jgi:hypothetical protein